MTESPTDRMLRVRAGDDEAFDELMLTHQSMVMGIIYRYLGGRVQEAEDLTQEVFLKVYRSRLRYQPSARFTTWLYRITANLCLNYRRDQSRRRMPSIQDLEGATEGRAAGFEDPRTDSPETEISRADARQQVKAALNQLPENQRIALILARYEGLSYREIAGILDISEKAIKSLLHRARTSLRQKIEIQTGTGLE